MQTKITIELFFLRFQTQFRKTNFNVIYELYDIHTTCKRRKLGNVF